MSLRHVLLVYLGSGGAAGYDIVKGFQHTYGYLWNASFQQVYRDLGKLHEEGLLDCEMVDNAPRPPRKIRPAKPADSPGSTASPNPRRHDRPILRRCLSHA